MYDPVLIIDDFGYPKAFAVFMGVSKDETTGLEKLKFHHLADDDVRTFSVAVKSVL